MDDLTNQQLILEHDIEATLVPQGYPIILPTGSSVVVTQYLGGNLTVMVQGNMAMIDEEELPKLGIKVDDDSDEYASLDDWVWGQLRRCYDPEIPVNIVDLGLIYRVDLKDGSINIDMTLTAAGCGMGPTIIDTVKRKIMKSDDIKEVNVNLVFDPPWTQDLMSDEAKLTLGMI
ncbi:MAG: iron-sulfur cluster assembly protein [Candidatus Comchoanobacterales bacterium]